MRLRKPSEFAAAYRLGSRAKGNILTVVVLPNNLGVSRLGLSVGKRIWKSAVRRNRVRRVFREAFRLSRRDLPEGADMILMAATSGIEPNLDATRTELVKLAHKALRRYEEKNCKSAPE